MIHHCSKFQYFRVVLYLLKYNGPITLKNSDIMTKYITGSQTLLSWCGSLFLIDYGSLWYVIHESILSFALTPLLSLKGLASNPANMRQLCHHVTLNKDCFFPGCMCTRLPHCLHTRVVCLFLSLAIHILIMCVCKHWGHNT